MHERGDRNPAPPRAPRIESLECIRQVLALVPVVEVVLHGRVHDLGAHDEICGHVDFPYGYLFAGFFRPLGAFTRSASRRALASVLPMPRTAAKAASWAFRGCDAPFSHE